jgi:hypothetical protein
MNELAPGIAVEMDFDMLFQLKRLKCIRRRPVTSDHIVSMHSGGRSLCYALIVVALSGA